MTVSPSSLFLPSGILGIVDICEHLFKALFTIRTAKPRNIDVILANYFVLETLIPRSIAFGLLADVALETFGHRKLLQYVEFNR